MNGNIAEYHVPVNTNIHDIDVIFVDEPDEIVNPLGLKCLVKSASSGSQGISPADIQRLTPRLLPSGSGLAQYVVTATPVQLSPEIPARPDRSGSCKDQLPRSL
jgi:hypothetical protein